MENILHHSGGRNIYIFKIYHHEWCKNFQSTVASFTYLNSVPETLLPTPALDPAKEHLKETPPTPEVDLEVHPWSFWLRQLRQWAPPNFGCLFLFLKFIYTPQQVRCPGKYLLTIGAMHN